MNIRTLPLTLTATAALAAVLTGCGGPAATPTREHTPTPGATTTTDAPGKVSATAFGPGWSDAGKATVADLKPIGPCGAPVFAQATDVVGVVATAPGGEKVVAGTIAPAAKGDQAALRTALQYCGAVATGGKTLTTQTVPLPGLVALTAVSDANGSPQALYGYSTNEVAGGKLEVVLVQAKVDASPADVTLYAQAVAKAYEDAAAGRTVTRVPELGKLAGDPLAPKSDTSPASDPLEDAPPGGYGTNSGPEVP